ncbi:MAG TPA: hypothetical protein VG893_10760 [Terracidiphilus sp.]|nr:hypothetical protein [Terracidiphilus sp.]
MTYLRTWRSKAVIISSVITGTIVGLLFRFAFIFGNDRFGETASLMTLAFLLAAPVAIGYWTVAEYLRITPRERIRWYVWLFLPILPLFAVILLSILLKWEGIICVLLGSPIMFFGGILGGIAARIVWQRIQMRIGDRLSALALPLLLLAVEGLIPVPQQIRTVQTEILIHAPMHVVWDNIKSVRLIKPDELPGSWIERAGFPKPLAATLSHEGVGGVREASFTGGLIFTETINQWQEGSVLRFSIHANTDSIPATTLDEHAKIGGQYFDVLEGEYQLEPRADGVLLHLESRERLSTHFNSYAGLWTDAVMRAIQEQILQVIKKRCEAKGQTEAD